MAILDADKEGYLRSETSLVQTIGRAARNLEGKVIMYADRMTKSMNYAISETDRRRKIQREYNEAHGIIPTSVKKDIRDIIEATKAAEETADYVAEDQNMEEVVDMGELEAQMRAAAESLDFETAAKLRDQIKAIKQS